MFALKSNNLLTKIKKSSPRQRLTWIQHLKRVFTIDISLCPHHQGEINWRQLKTEDVQFVFINATEGGDFKDKKFKDNWQKAKASGIAVGGYHFYRLCKSGAEQAKIFIESVFKRDGYFGSMQIEGT